MKKSVGILVIIAICAIALEGKYEAVYAQTAGQEATDKTFKLADDLNVSVGFKTWFNTWSSGGKVFSGTTPLSLETYGKGWIPTVGVRYKDFFLSASGMFGTNYDHSTIPGFPAFEMRMQRKEVDVNLGYYILPWVAVSAGYKGVFMKFACLPTPPCFKVDYDFNGPTAGLSVNIPIPEWNVFPSGFSVYGNAGGGYMWVHPSINARTLTNHAFYGNFEGGIAYKPPILPIALTVGYRYQRIETRFKSDIENLPQIPSNEKDITKGPIVGISFVF